MSGLTLFKCCEHCPPVHAIGGPDEHVYRCYETDDGKPCEQGSQHAEKQLDQT
jgi:hypothetical protein